MKHTKITEQDIKTILDYVDSFKIIFRNPATNETDLQARQRTIRNELLSLAQKKLWAYSKELNGELEVLLRKVKANKDLI